MEHDVPVLRRSPFDASAVVTPQSFWIDVVKTGSCAGSAPPPSPDRDSKTARGFRSRSVRARRYLGRTGPTGGLEASSEASLGRRPLMTRSVPTITCPYCRTTFYGVKVTKHGVVTCGKCGKLMKV